MKYCIQHPERKATHTLTSGNDTFLHDRIMEAITESVRAQVEEAVKVVLARAKEDLDRRVPEIVAGVSLRAMERISMERLGPELVIHVRLDDNRTPRI